MLRTLSDLFGSQGTSSNSNPNITINNTVNNTINNNTINNNSYYYVESVVINNHCPHLNNSDPAPAPTHANALRVAYRYPWHDRAVENEVVEDEDDEGEEEEEEEGEEEQDVDMEEVEEDPVEALTGEIRLMSLRLGSLSHQYQHLSGAYEKLRDRVSRDDGHDQEGPSKRRRL